MRLSDAQKDALRVGSSERWLGALEVNVTGSTMVALERRGLAKVRERRKPYRRFVYRLTPAGARERARRIPLSELTDAELVERYIDDEEIDLRAYGDELERRFRALR